MQNRYNLLQSGFLSLENKLLVTPQRQDSDLEFDAYILNKPYKNGDNVYFYHKGLDEIYKEYLADQRVSVKFDFQEKAILSFMDALSVNTFAEWVALQNNNPHLSSMHYRFILDTIAFMLGKGRSISADSWELLIDKDNVYSKKMAEKFNISTLFDNRNTGTFFDKLPFNLPAMLQCWISKPMGFSDFMVTAGIIFGQKAVRKSVA